MSLIHASSLPDVDIPEMSITDYVFHKASAYPDRIAVSDGAGGTAPGTAGQFLWQPGGVTHAYENRGDQPLEIVEMQWR